MLIIQEVTQYFLRSSVLHIKFNLFGRVHVLSGGCIYSDLANKKRILIIMKDKIIEL